MYFRLYLLVLLLGFNSAIMTTNAQTFDATCDSISLQGPILSANCFNTNGQENPTSLDLDACLVNNDGRLYVCGL